MNDKNAKQYTLVTAIDNTRLQADADKTAETIKKIGDTAIAESIKINQALKKAVNTPAEELQKIFSGGNILQVAAKDIKELGETEKTEAEIYANTLQEILDKYRTFEQRRAELNKAYDNERKTIEGSGITQNEKESAVSLLEQKRKEALKAVNDEELASLQKSSQILVSLFADTSKKSISELLKITETANELVSYLEKTEIKDITPKFGFSTSQLQLLKESPGQLDSLRNAVKKLNDETGKNSPLIKFGNDIETAFAKMSKGDIAEGLKGMGSTLQNTTANLKTLGKGLGSLFGDSDIGKDFETVSTLINGVGSGIEGIGQIASGNIIGGVTSLISGITSIFSMASEAEKRHKEALKAVATSELAQRRTFNQLLREQNLLYEEGSTIFGSDLYGKAANSIKIAQEAVSEFNTELKGTDEQIKKQQKNAAIKDIFGINDPQSEKKQLYAGLADIEVVTGHKKTGLFGWGKGKDVYSNILDVYPELIDESGKFNKELAESIVQTRKMTEADKATLQNIIDTFSQYEEAMKQTKEYLGSIFGELGNSISDALVDAFTNGTDAAAAFTDSVTGMLETLAKQMVYSVTIAPVIKKAEEEMLKIMNNGTLTDEEKFAQYTKVLSDFIDNSGSMTKNSSALLDTLQKTAEEKGIELFQPTGAQHSISPRGIATASQESVTELNGRMTAVQGHTFLLSENSKILVGNSNRILEHLSGIEGNTRNLSRLSGIETEIHSVKTALDNISIKGIKIKQ